MENSPFIRFRIEPDIAARAHRMAAEQGLDLPQVMRMMLTKAVSTGSFSIDRVDARPTRGPGHPLFVPYEARYWSEVKNDLDAETALAALHHAIACSTAALDDGLRAKDPDVHGLEEVRAHRDEACALLDAFDPRDAGAVASILERFAPAPGAVSGPEGGA